MLSLIALIVAVTLVVSFFCSLTESSLYSISRARIETLRRQGDPRGMILARLRDRVDEPIAAILILNTIMNGMGPALAAALLADRFGSGAVGLFALAFTGAILFLGEIVPKSLGFKFSDATAPALAWPLRLLIILLWPLVKLCVLLTNSFGPNSRIAVTEDDIMSMASLSQASGAIHPQKAKWIANALRLDKLSARDLMTPLSVVRRVAADMPLNMTKTDADHWRFSRIPVYVPGQPDQVVGVVQRRVVFNHLIERKEGLMMRDIMAPSVFVLDRHPAHELISLFIKYRNHLFCVRDKRNRWLGIITLEDVLEALIGVEIVGEQDLYEDMQQAARQVESAQTLTQDLRRGGGILEQVVVSAACDLIGKTLRDSGLPQQAIVGAILRHGTVIVPRGDVELQAGDKITLIGAKDDVEKAKARLHPGPKEPQRNERQQ